MPCGKELSTESKLINLYSERIKIIADCYKCGSVDFSSDFQTWFNSDPTLQPETVTNNPEFNILVPNCFKSVF